MISILISSMLPDGDLAIFPPGVGDAGYFISLRPEDLPALPDGMSFVSAVKIVLMDDGVSVDRIPGDQPLILSFVIPPELIGSQFTILFWDPTLNGGQGGWVEIVPVLLVWDAALNNGLGGWINATSAFFDAIPNPQGVEQRIAIEIYLTGIYVLVVND